ncbi:hypothetical protein KUF83_30235 [Streptomyces sp. BV286]|uniref:hypothetical protein n=1 Tax=Streptomyces sp. BV286 TaxID=2849672 RepID=UPI001C2EB4B0|nr:hypothetical protein [Streptomyces sp. BV286]MBV1940816.1 hypothetical protein [Streptomyces sp. BV286]
MPTRTLAPALPAAVTVLQCSECGHGTFTAGRDGKFHCSCGTHVLPSEVEMNLDSDDVWCVTPGQSLAVVTAPTVAWRRYREARTDMDDPGVWGPPLEAAHVEFRTALAELEAAQLMGLQMPHGIDVQIGRVYLTCVVRADGSLAGSEAFALGWDCKVCAPHATHGRKQERYPCRQPRAHAWGTANGWAAFRTSRDGRTDHVVSPLAADLPTARERAAAVLNARRSFTATV